MRKTTTRAFLVLCAVAAAVSVATGGPEPTAPAAKRAKLGAQVPDFTLTDTEGVKRTLSEYKGKIVVLEWINPSCPFVVNCYRTGAMQKAYAQVKELDEGAVWLAINTTYNTSLQQNRRWIELHKLAYPILLDVDGDVGRAYDARRTPHMFVIDGKGVLRYHGAIDDNKFSNKQPPDVTNYVVNAVRQIVSDETVAPDYVAPYGCSVKYKPRSR
jgi:peroxiredoxin